jgi:hypothetical protein
MYVSLLFTMVFCKLNKASAELIISKLCVTLQQWLCRCPCGACTSRRSMRDGVLRGQEDQGWEAVRRSQSTSDRAFVLQLNFICVRLVMIVHSAYKILLTCALTRFSREILRIRIAAVFSIACTS